MNNPKTSLEKIDTILEAMIYLLEDRKDPDKSKELIDDIFDSFYYWALDQDHTYILNFFKQNDTKNAKIWGEHCQFEKRILKQIFRLPSIANRQFRLGYLIGEGIISFMEQPTLENISEKDTIRELECQYRCWLKIGEKAYVYTLVDERDVYYLADFTTETYKLTKVFPYDCRN